MTGVVPRARSYASQPRMVVSTSSRSLFGIRDWPGAPVLPGPARRRATLSLVPRAVDRRTVRVLGRRGQPEDAELTDLHARPQGDRQIGHIGQFQRHMPGEPGVDEPG